MERPTPTGIEARFDAQELLVSKTDMRGVITYANQRFVQISGYEEDELLGKPHNIVRHPLMPRCVFDLMWETLRDGKEIFAFVVNLAKDGRHYWVFAHVTPDVSPVTGEVIGYHSSRRQASREAVRAVQSVYEELRHAEMAHSSRRDQCAAGRRALDDTLLGMGMTYEMFVLHTYTANMDLGRVA